MVSARRAGQERASAGTGTRAGFTLIEMLIVLSLIALLLSVALPRYMGSMDTSREVVLIENLRTLRISIDKFHGDTGRYPETLEELVARKYLRRVPVDPVTESTDTWILLAPQDGETSGIADVRSGAAGETREGVAYGEL